MFFYGDLHKNYVISRHTCADAEVTVACSSSAVAGLEGLLGGHSAGDSVIRHHSLPESTSTLLESKARDNIAERVSLFMGVTIDHPMQGKSPEEVDRVKQGLLVEEVQSCLQACHGADLVLFNLFSCEGYFIAHHLGVPCVAVSPFLVTR